MPRLMAGLAALFAWRSLRDRRFGRIRAVQGDRSDAWGSRTGRRLRRKDVAGVKYFTAAQILDNRRPQVPFGFTEGFKKAGRDAEIHFERLAVTDEQIRDWRLPSRPTKTTDMRAAAFANRRSVELDAIDPNRLRKLVEDAINRRMSKKLYAKLMKAEQDEQDEIRELVDQIS